MRVLYNLCMYVGVGWLRVLRPLIPRYRLFFQERSRLWLDLEKNPALQRRPLVWLHVASLGEFEQIRPLIVLLREKHPKLSLLLTFFSPSGYRLRADYDQVDGVAYLPLDFPQKMQKFFQLVRPTLGLVVKYEFWPNMCHEAYKQEISLVSVGAIFRPKQIYFRRGFGFLVRALHAFKGFLVQDVRSAQLLRRMHCERVEVVGDSRYDGVAVTAEQVADFPLLLRFKGEENLVLLWGSLWPDEWPTCAQVILQTPSLRHIIAPHQPRESFLARIQARFPRQVLRYSTYEEDLGSSLTAPRILLIDSVGMLARAYRYADIAYVGGGKRGALHNILEPAVYGVPVLFWAHKAHAKFPEAEALRQSGGAVSIHSTATLLRALHQWTQHAALRKQAAQAAAEFVAGRRGATQKIYNYIKKLAPLCNEAS